jgi:hypothetical protein
VEFVVERLLGSLASQKKASVIFVGKKWFSLKSRKRRLSSCSWTTSTKGTAVNSESI